MKNNNKITKENPFDFDTWVALAQNSPDMFEKKRQELINSVIKQAPDKMQVRLNGLQWSIDAKIKTSKNPMDGCIKIYQMMMDSVYGSKGLVEALNRVDIENMDDSNHVLNNKNVSNVFELK